MDVRVEPATRASKEQAQAEPGRWQEVRPPRKSPFGLFYGWWMVAIAAAVQFLAGGFYQLGFSVYFLPISRDLGLSRTALSLAFSLRSFEGGLDAPVMGYLVDRLGPRFMIRAGSILTGLGFVLLAFTQDYLSFLVVFIGLMAVGIHAGAALPSASLVNHWFARQRALATTLSHIGVEIGGTLLTPLVALLVLSLGWRQAAVVSGVVFLALVPLLSFFVRNTPESMGMRPDGDPPRRRSDSPPVEGKLFVTPLPNPSPQGGRGLAAPLANAPAQGGSGLASWRGPQHHEGDFGVRESLRSFAFWRLAAAIGMRQFSKQTLTVHLIPLLVWKGFDEQSGAVLLGLFALFQIPLRIASAYAADRWSMTKVSALSALAGVGAIVALLMPGHDWVANGLLFVLFFALGETGNSPGWAVIGDYFGRGNYATIRGAVSFAQSAISLPAPVVAGWVYDTTQSYYLALLPIAGSYLLAFLLFWGLRRPRERVVETVSGIVAPS